MTRIRVTVLGLGLAEILVSIAWAANKVYAKSYLNRRAPTFVVERWISPEPQRAGKFLLIDFWATWCRPCRDGIPALNEIHRRLGDRVVVIGVSDEPEEKVRRMKSPRIEYFVAIDTMKRMHGALGIKAIPHAILVDASGIVRWQGCPMPDEDNLTPEVIEKILKEPFNGPPLGINGQEAEVGTYGSSDIQLLRGLLAKVSFPATEGSVARTLPRAVKPLPLEVINWLPDQEKKGRMGGDVTEYWLNADHVLRVATVNYMVGDRLSRRDEWAVILTKRERETYVRSLYPSEDRRTP